MGMSIRPDQTDLLSCPVPAGCKICGSKAFSAHLFDGWWRAEYECGVTVAIGKVGPEWKLDRHQAEIEFRRSRWKR